ncbi:MAG: peptide synthetase [Oscillospiraceae bacterium]|nr:peptide synthetase [Oscillospiraceae bacterium]
MEKIIGGIKRDCYPITEAELLHLYTMSFSPTAEIVNLGTGRYLQMPINNSVLREALNRAVSRCETMRLRFWKEPETDKIWQYVMPYENQHFEYYDFSELSEEKAHAILDCWTSQPFDTFGGPLSRIVLVSMPNGYNGYYMNVHHATMDAASIITFNRDVMDIYCSLMYDLPYPKPMTSYIESVKKDMAYMAGCKKKDADEKYWHEQFSRDEPIYTDFTGPGRLQTQRCENNNPNQRAGLLLSRDAAGSTVTYDLDVDSTMKLVHFCEEHGLPVSVLILHGLRTVLSKFNNNEKDICIKDFVARRSTVLAKKCGGVRMHCMTLRTIVEPTNTVLEALDIIDKAQNDLFKHSEYGPMTFYRTQREFYGVEKGGGYESVGFTYQPATLKSIAPYLKGIPYKNFWYSSGKQPQAFYLTAMHRPSDGGLTFHFGYQSDVATPHEIEFLYYYLGRVIFRSIENPNATIEEIMDMV